MAKKGKKMSAQADMVNSLGGDTFIENVIAKSHKQVYKSKQKKTANNDLDDILGENSLQLIDGGKVEKRAKTIEWKNIKAGISYFKMPVELWTDTNMFSTLRALCKSSNQEYANVIDSQIGVAVRGRFINRLRAVIAEKFNATVSNRRLFDYINYFVNYEIDDFVAANGKFSVYDFTDKRSVSRFMKYTNKEIPVDVEKENNSKINLIDIEAVYNLGGTNLMLSYGIVIPYNWLLQKKNLTSSQAKNVVCKFYQDAIKQGKEFMSEIIGVTKKLAPYPTRYGDENVHAMLHELNVDSIVFDANGKEYF